jgi:hypothetical protein
MEAFSLAPDVWLLASIQILGGATALLARLGERSAFQSSCHRLFIASMLLVGIATAASLALGPPVALIGGASLAVMSVAAVCELRPADLDVF